MDASDGRYGAIFFRRFGVTYFILNNLYPADYENRSYAAWNKKC